MGPRATLRRYLAWALFWLLAIAVLPHALNWQLGPPRSDASILASLVRRALGDVDTMDPGAKFGIVFGDSVNRLTDVSNAPELTLLIRYELLKSRGKSLGDMPLLPLVCDGFKPSDYDVLSRAFASRAIKPAWVLIPVNLRAFSASWYASGLWKHPELERFLPWGDLLRGKGWQPAEESLVAFGAQKLDERWSHVGDLPRDLGAYYRNFVDLAFVPALARHGKSDCASLQANYLGGLDGQNPMLESLRACVRTWARAGVPAVVYATPINMALLRDCSPNGDSVARASLLAILNAAASEGASIFNYSEIMPPDAFYQRVNEHLRYPYKLALAHRIAADMAMTLKP